MKNDDVIFSAEDSGKGSKIVDSPAELIGELEDRGDLP